MFAWSNPTLHASSMATYGRKANHTVQYRVWYIFGWVG